MPNEIGMMGKCMRARYGDPCRSLAYQVKARGIQKKSMTIPIVIRMFDVRLESFMEGFEYTRRGAWS